MRFCSALWLGLLLGSSIASANDQGRLQSIKQQALALYTLRLADQRQFSPSVSILVGQQGQDIRLQQLSLSIDGVERISYRYQAAEAALLAHGLMQPLGLNDIARGPHSLEVRLRWRSQGSDELRETTTQQVLSLDQWPRGLSLLLQADARREQASLSLRSPIDGGGILRSAEFESAQGHALKALTQLQMLAHVDPALAQSSAARELQARALRDWGLAGPAQATFAALAQDSRNTEALRIRSRLEADRLSLREGNSPQLLDQAALKSWPAPQRQQAELQQTLGLLLQGRTDDALTRLPQGGSMIDRYNIAVALLQQQRDSAGEQLLQQLAASAIADRGDELNARIADLSRLKLAWLHRVRGNGETASRLLAQVRKDGPFAERALLALGWSQLLPLIDPTQALPDDGFRPRHIQAIDAALRKQPPTAAEALRSALRYWAPLQQGDPLDPAVQEAQVATAYALLRLGEIARAVQYGELAIERLEAVREHLKQAMRDARKGLALNGHALVRGNWPPSPSSWAREFVAGAWWQDSGNSLQVPEHAYRMRLLALADSARILESMHRLNQVEKLMDAVVEHPDLANRATALRKRIESERAAQQKALDRHAYYWLRLELERATRYLILGRFSLAQAYAQRANRPQENTP